MKVSVGQELGKKWLHGPDQVYSQVHIPHGMKPQKGWWKYYDRHSEWKH